MLPQTPESGRICPDHEPMRPTKQPRLTEAEESKAVEAEESEAAEAQGSKVAETQGPKADDPDEKYWLDSSMLNLFFG
ncbi:hypothetical protein C1H46_032639 [Malus baccata]|uniref:Uncharacterized protein n=1 Tax=Malus baccata TaxID=106549 RepID=A0A540L642_MALBA|nr:hypothetical protein C1H46_032639 [Malus baccata]